MHSSIQRRHHSRYAPSARRSRTPLPYSLPRLNGGSAKTVSTQPSKKLGRMARQSPLNRAPSFVVKKGRGSPARQNDFGWNIFGSGGWFGMAVRFFISFCLRSAGGVDPEKPRKSLFQARLP